MAPVETGDAYLDLHRNFVNEWESHKRREEALFRATLPLVLEARALLRLSILLNICGLAAAGLVAYLLVRLFGGAPVTLLVAPLIVLVALVALAVLFGLLRIVLFAAAVSYGLRRIQGEKHPASGLWADIARATPGLAALAIARLLAGLGGFLYAALIVFVVPVLIAQGGGYREAQRRSEELVSRRWGPGRVRAIGLPSMRLSDVAYSALVRRFGYAGAYLQLIPLGALLLIPLIAGLVAGSELVAILTFAGLLGSALLALIAWSVTMQPLLAGILNAHLYDYAVSGEARPPYRKGVLHSCLREEIRAKLGTPQRGPEEAHLDASSGARGVLSRLSRRGLRYAEHEAGLGRSEGLELVRGVRSLWSDSRSVLSAIRAAGAGGATAGEIDAVTGLDPRRRQVVIQNLMEQGYVQKVAGAEPPRFRPTSERPRWWEAGTL
ncbi:MAG: hypothetical protein ACRDKV_04235 [Solirubrobacterales bacterium]